MSATCATCAHRNWGEIDNLLDPEMCYCHEFDMEVGKDDDPCVYYEEAQKKATRGTTDERSEREA